MWLEIRFPLVCDLCSPGRASADDHDAPGLSELAWEQDVVARITGASGITIALMRLGERDMTFTPVRRDWMVLAIRDHAVFGLFRLEQLRLQRSVSVLFDILRDIGAICLVMF